MTASTQNNLRQNVTEPQGPHTPRTHIQKHLLWFWECVEIIDYDLIKITVTFWSGFTRLIVVQESSAVTQNATQTVVATDGWKHLFFHSGNVIFQWKTGCYFNRHEAGVCEMSSVSFCGLTRIYTIKTIKSNTLNQTVFSFFFLFLPFMSILILHCFSEMNVFIACLHVL